MAMFGSNMPGEVGLRLLLCPFGSNIVIRTACCSVGTVLPVYSTFKAIETKDQNEQQKWLMYWAAYGSFSIAEVFADKVLYWYSSQPNFVPFLLCIVYLTLLVSCLARYCSLRKFLLSGFIRFPLYYHAKFAFLVWLQLPSFDGARHLYMNHLRPFLLRHQVRLDQFAGFLYGEMAKFVSAHQAEIQFGRTFLMKILVSVNQMVRYIIHPVQGQANSAIEGPRTEEQNSESDNSE
ncbi:hypothetical protein F0562_020602 [Nyssa sinensis]|uniref:HVA22-like protein n=1 Tax=Nyssa sinensis TaxID=561372 RepID=A0A5J5BW55_9ASTE|nr:hypothetical protein F0562_020602 [Nyssa sinensis]